MYTYYHCTTGDPILAEATSICIHMREITCYMYKYNYTLYKIYDKVKYSISSNIVKLIYIPDSEEIFLLDVVHSEDCKKVAETNGSLS